MHKVFITEFFDFMIRFDYTPNWFNVEYFFLFCLKNQKLSKYFSNFIYLKNKIINFLRHLTNFYINNFL